MIEIKAKDGKVKIHMTGSAGELFFELYNILERFATSLKEDDRGTDCYNEFCRMLRTIADGKTREEYAAQLLEEFKNLS